MVLSDAVTTRLLGAIETDSLVFLCGAGLSIPPPSDLLSAVRVSQICYDAWVHTEPLDPALRDKVDRLAGHFHARGAFERVFIRRLVPWNELVGPPNNGHAAIADLLIGQSEIVVCAGAIELGVPAKLIAPGRGASTIRPTPGGSAWWLTLERARVELGL